RWQGDLGRGSRAHRLLPPQDQRPLQDRRPAGAKKVRQQLIRESTVECPSHLGRDERASLSAIAAPHTVLCGMGYGCARAQRARFYSDWAVISAKVQIDINRALRKAFELPILALIGTPLSVPRGSSWLRPDE